MIESVLAPLVFTVVVFSILVYAGLRRLRRSTSDGGAREHVDQRDAGDVERPQRRTGTDG